MINNNLDERLSFPERTVSFATSQYESQDNAALQNGVELGKRNQSQTKLTDPFSGNCPITGVPFTNFAINDTDPSEAIPKEEFEAYRKRLETIYDDDEDNIQPRHRIMFEHQLSWAVFFKFLIYHLLYYFVLGPFIIILTPFTGYNVMYNQRFIGWNIISFIQGSQYFTIVSFFLFYQIVGDVEIGTVELYMLISTIIIRCLTIGSKYGHFNKILLNDIQTKKLDNNDLRHFFLLGDWNAQDDWIIEEELQALVLTLNIDISFLYFSFLQDTHNPNLRFLKKQSLKKSIAFRKMESSINPKTSINLSQEETPAREYNLEEECPNVKVSLLRKAFEKRYLVKTTRFDDKYFYGYNLAFEMINRAKAKKVNDFDIGLFIISVIQGLIPSVYRVWFGMKFLTSRPWLSMPLISLNILFFYFNLRITVKIIEDLSRRIFLMKEMAALINPMKRPYSAGSEEPYSNFNVFDIMTLKTWASLRLIFMHYGDRFIHRNNMNITMITLFYVSILAVILLQGLGITKIFESIEDYTEYVAILGFGSVLFFGIFLSIMYYGAFLNDQYRIHKDLLRKNRTVVKDLKRFSNFMEGENPIEPKTFLYKEGLRTLREELGEEDFARKLEEKTEKLAQVFDDIIEELNFEELNNCFKLFGIPISYTLLQSVLVGLASVGAALLKKIF